MIMEVLENIQQQVIAAILESENLGVYQAYIIGSLLICLVISLIGQFFWLCYPPRSKQGKQVVSIVGTIVVFVVSAFPFCLMLLIISPLIFIALPVFLMAVMFHMSYGYVRVCMIPAKDWTAINYFQFELSVASWICFDSFVITIIFGSVGEIAIAVACFICFVLRWGTALWKFYQLISHNQNKNTAEFDKLPLKCYSEKMAQVV
ncbi:hypothetical protein MP228_010301 [Amoeboaphelidium protococcarum]|nr:hypothetical protein MP228_010301 [Amoeboaphelidium protococcarum]